MKILFLFLLFISQLLSNDKTVYFEKMGNHLIINNDNIFDITIKINNDKVYRVKEKSMYIVENFNEKKISYKWIIGDYYAIHDDNYIYNLPIPKNEPTLLTQGYNGKLSHKGKSQYALDFGLKEGTPIYSIREGKVVKVVNKIKKNCFKEKKSCPSNNIIIKHEDNTYSKYSHLKYKGIIVKEGDTIKKNQHIGFSGNTGYSSGPHLHMLVFKTKKEFTRESIPIKFKTQKGIEHLKEQKIYIKSD